MKCTSKINNPCPSYPNAKCIVYTGSNLTCIGVNTNDRLDVILEKIDEKLCTFSPTIYIQEGPGIDITGSGSFANPYIVSADLYEGLDNTITFIDDALYVPPGAAIGGNQLVYGGIVTWSGVGYVYDVTAAGYYINGVFYESPATQVTLDPADPTFDRFDDFIVTTTSQVDTITGTASADPLIPDVDPATQLLLTSVLVQAGSLTPAQEECLYTDNGEWTAVSSTVRIDVASINTPFSGATNIEGTLVQNGDNFSLTRPSGTLEPFAYTSLSFKIKSKAAWGVNGLIIQFYNGATPIGSSVPIVSGSFGFDDTQISSYQTITIPISSFGIGSQVDINKVVFTAQNPILGTFGWHIDSMCLLVTPYVSPPFVNLIFQSGLKRVGNVVELGIDWGGYANPNVGPFNSYLQHNTAIHTFAHTLYHTGFPVWKPITETYQQQTFGIATDVATFLSSGTVKATEPDYQNRVRLHLGYTGQNYQDDDIMWGYMQDRIGYWLGTNLFGAGSFGIQLDDKDSKTTGIFMHTFDNTNDDAVTIFGAPQNVTGILNDQPLTVTGENLIKNRIAIFKTDKDIQILGYPNTRDDGDATRFLTTDVDGNVELRDIDFSGASIVITADNGLTKDTPTNVQWGGTLLHNTTIAQANFDSIFSTGRVLMTNSRFETDLGAEVAAANNLTLGSDGNVFPITGSTQINAITTSGWQAGSQVELIIIGSPVIKHNTAGGAGTAPILLAGSSDYSAASNDVLNLTYDGSVWREESRTLATSIPFTGITADNGLTENVANNIQLGGTLLQNTTIATTANFGLTISGDVPESTSFGALIVTNNHAQGRAIWATSNGGTGIAVNATANTGQGVYSVTESGTAITANATTTGDGIVSTTITGIPGHFKALPSSTNTVVNVLKLSRGTTGSAANNIGGSIDFYNTSSTTDRLSNQVYSRFTTVSDGTRTSQLVITGVNSGSTVDKLLIGGPATLVNATRFETYKGADVISAGDLVLGTDGNVFDIIAGAAQINAITTTDWQAGSQVILKFETSTTVKHNTAGGAGTAPMFLAGAVDYEATTNDILFLEYDGTNWHEVSRKLTSGAPVVTANNGLTKNTATNIQLGGALVQDTTIANGAFTLSVTGNLGYGAGDEGIFRVIQSSASGQGIYATATSSSEAAIQGVGGSYGVRGSGAFAIYGDGTAVGVTGTTSAGTGVSGASTSGIGVNGQSASSFALAGSVTPASTTGNAPILKIERLTSGTAANDISGSIDFYTEADNGTSNISNQLISKLTTAAVATNTSQFEIWGTNSGSINQIMSAYGSGVVGIGKFSSYTGTRLEVVDDAVAGASVIKVTSTSTAATGNNQKLIEAVLSGANANTTQTTSAIFGSNSHTGTNATNFGVRGEVTNGTVSGAGVYGIAAADQSGVLGLSVTGNGVAGSSTSGAGGAFTSSSGSAVNATSTSSYGLVSFSSTGESANFQINPASTNTLATVARFTRLSSGTPAAGIGSQIAFHPETDTTSANPAAHIGAYWTDVANGTRTGDLAIYTTNSAVSGLALTVTSDKKIVTTGRVLGTQGADVASVAGAIALTAGNVFEVTGTNTITLISNVGWQNGSEVTLVFTSTAAVASGTATSGTDITIILAGGATFNGSANDTLTLILCEVGGTQAWREKCRSVN